MATTDTLNHPPGDVGGDPLRYNATDCRPAKGSSIVDPTHGETVIRMTNVGSASNPNEQYAFHNGNCDGTLMFSNTTGGSWDVVSTEAGSYGNNVYTGQPTGTHPIFEIRWDMEEPLRYYFYQNAAIYRRDLALATSTLVKDFNAIMTSGISLTFNRTGSVNTITRGSGSFVTDGFLADLAWIRVSGTSSNNRIFRVKTVTALVLTIDEDYQTVTNEVVSAVINNCLTPMGGTANYQTRDADVFLVNLSGKCRLWKRSTDALSSQFVEMTNWIGLFPSGNHIYTAAGSGSYPQIQHLAYACDPTVPSINTSSIQVYGGTGDHAAMVSASDGIDYIVLQENDDDTSIYAFDVSVDRGGLSHAAQRALGRKLCNFKDAGGADNYDSGTHMSGVSVGQFKDYAFIVNEAQDDDFNEAVGPWRPFKSEIFAVKVTNPPAVRRLTMSRARTPDWGDHYAGQPRVSSSGNGKCTMWGSNYNVNAAGGDYADLHMVDFALGAFDEEPETSTLRAASLF